MEVNRGSDSDAEYCRCVSSTRGGRRGILLQVVESVPGERGVMEQVGEGNRWCWGSMVSKEQSVIF